MKTRKLLLATDLSANSAFAAKWAFEYAQKANVAVALVHVIELSVPNWLRDQYNVVENNTKLNKMKAKLTEWYEVHTGSVPDEIHVRVGNVQDVLTTMAEEEDVSAIVLARSGKSALTKFLAGSTAQMLAANPPCTVVIVHPDHTQFSEATKIAVATDLTESAAQALAASALFADFVGGHLDIIHASGLGAEIDIDDIALSGDNLDGLAQRAQSQMDVILKKHTAHLEPVNYNTHILNDTPVDAMKAFVEANHVDIVVVGNASSYNILTNIFRRVSVKLTQVLPCTVVVVPPNVALFADNATNEEA